MSNFWEDKKVLVTGGTGFVGSALVNRLLQLNVGKVFVLGKDLAPEISLESSAIKVVGDISDKDFINQLFKENSFDICFHLAAQPLVSEGDLSPLPTIQTNIMGTANILEAARNFKLKGVVLASTTHVYGNNEVPFLEEYFPRPSRPYETSKACADMLAQTYALYYDLPIAIGRFVNIYGPGDPNERIVPKTIKLLLQNKNPEIYDDQVNRDYLFIEDAIDGYIILAEKISEISNKKSNIIYNFGTGLHYSTAHIVETIIKLMNKSDIKPIKIENVRKKEIINQYVSIDKTLKTLGWQARHNLEDGLMKTINWHQNNVKPN